MEKCPFSYTDAALVEHDLRSAALEVIELETVELSSLVSARDAAIGIVLGAIPGGDRTPRFVGT